MTLSDYPKGTIVTVIKGRRLVHGTTGEVFWSGKDKFKPGQVRVGFKVPGSREPIWASDWEIEIVPDEPEFPDAPTTEADWDAMFVDAEEPDPEPYEVAHGPRNASPFDTSGELEAFPF